MSLGTIKNSLLIAVALLSLFYTSAEAQMRLGSRIRALRCARVLNQNRLQCSRFQHSCCSSGYHCFASATKRNCWQSRSCQQTCVRSCGIQTCKKTCCRSSSCSPVVRCCCKANCCNRPPCQEPEYTQCLNETGDFIKCFEEFCALHKPRKCNDKNWSQHNSRRSPSLTFSE